MYHKGELLINKYVKKLDFVKMSVSFASLHNPLTTFSHLFPIVFYPLSPTDNGPVAIVRVNKSPLQTPTGPLFWLLKFSSEKYIVKEQCAWTDIYVVRVVLNDYFNDHFSEQLKSNLTFDPLIITTHYIHVNYLLIISLTSGLSLL